MLPPSIVRNELNLLSNCFSGRHEGLVILKVCFLILFRKLIENRCYTVVCGKSQ